MIFGNVIKTIRHDSISLTMEKFALMNEHKKKLLPVLFVFTGIFTYAGNDNISSFQKTQMAASIHSQSIQFTENNGQMADMSGNPIPQVLFKVEVPNLNIWLTTQGLTYQFLKIVENEEELEKLNTGSNSVSGIFDQNSKIEKSEWHRVDMILKNADIKKENVFAEGNVTQCRRDYFLGHCPEGILDVKSYSKVIIKEVYKGIDWVLYGTSEGSLKYDFFVHPNADPSQIKLIYEGSGKINVGSDRIHFGNELGEVIEGTLLCYQNSASPDIEHTAIERIVVESEYKAKKTINKISNGFSYEVAITLREYDVNDTLIIDPQLYWGTYYGGNNLDSFQDCDVDNNGNIFVGGFTSSTNFPTVPLGGAYNQSFVLDMCAIILKFSNSGQLLWATCYGNVGPLTSIGVVRNITVDIFGNVFVIGNANLSSFPLFSSGTYFESNTSNQSTFILKFNNNGQRLWATGFAAGNSNGRGIVTDLSGNVFITGETWGPTPLIDPGNGAYFNGTLVGQTDGYFAKFTNNGILLWSTYFGGNLVDTPEELCRDNLGNIFAVGYTRSSNFPLKNPLDGSFFDNTLGVSSGAFVLKFSAASCKLLWSTYLSGSSGFAGFGDKLYEVVCDNNNNIYVAGFVQTTNLPIITPGSAYVDNTLNGIADVYIARFNSTIHSLYWSTYYGGAGNENYFATYYRMGLITDHCNNVYITGKTDGSGSFPVYNPSGCNNYYVGQNTSTLDGFIVQFNSIGVRQWSTLFAGATATDYSICNALAIDNQNNLFVVGEWKSAGIPNGLKNPGGAAYFNNLYGGSDDACIVKLTPSLPAYTQSQVNPTGCSACNGTATVNVTTCSGSNLNYTWSNGSQTFSTPSTTNTATGLCPGSYTVTISDVSCNNTTGTLSYILTGGSGSITINNTQVDAMCKSSCNGSITITPAGGISPYTYSWSNGQITQTASGLCSGSYSVVVTDLSNCKFVKNFIITEPLLDLSIGTATQWSCLTNTGIATATPANGSSPYLYTWSTGQTNSTVSGLTAGTTYSVTVTDVNGCSTARTVAVNTPKIISSSINIDCNNSTGSATATLIGGIAPYTYKWSNGSSGPDLTSLSAGIYTVSVTDANGCTLTNVSVITGTVDSATFTMSPGGTICTGSAVNFTNTGSAGTYNNWKIFNLGTFAKIADVLTINFTYTFSTPGTYRIQHIIQTSALCPPVSLYKDVTVITCTGPTVTVIGSSVCQGSCATVTTSGSGGTSPYTYNWSNGATTQNINPCPVSTTTYTVTIKDTGGNTSTSIATITVNPAVIVTIQPTNITCSGVANGTAIANPGNGTPAYTFNWSGGVPGSGFQVSGLSAGTYTVTVTDSKGCTASSSATIFSPPPLSGRFSMGTSDCAACGCKEWIMITASGGTSPYSYSWPDGYINRYKNQLCPGTYTINIKDNNGCSINVNLSAP